MLDGTPLPARSPSQTKCQIGWTGDPDALHGVRRGWVEGNHVIAALVLFDLEEAVSPDEMRQMSRSVAPIPPGDISVPSSTS